MPTRLHLAGHGVTVVPRPPFALERHGGRGGDAIVVTHRVPAGLPRRLVLVPGPEGCAVEPGGGVADPAAVAEIAAGPAAARWVLRCAGLELDWPEGFRVESGPAPDEPPGFDLVAPGGLLLTLHGPLPGAPARPEPHLVPGLRVTAQGEAGPAAWCEVEFRQEQALWRQRAVAVRLDGGSCVATLRAPAATAGTPAWEAAFRAASALRRA